MNITIDQLVYKIYRKMTNQSWIAFLGALIGGFFAHLFILTNEFCNHDDIGGWMEQGGIAPTRWLQSITGWLVSPLGSGMMAGSLTILILSVSALFLVDTLKIESYALSAIIGIMMTASPIVACFMSYLNGSYQFVVGVPFAILAVRWYENGWKGYILSALCLMCAIAGYQSNLAITIALFYIVLFARLLDSDVDLKKWWISFAKAFGLLILGLLFYLLSNKVVSFIAGDGGLSGGNGYSIGITTGNLEVSGYEAQAETGTLYLTEIPRTIVVAVKYFIKYHFNIFFGGANLSFASKVNVLSSIVLAATFLFAFAESFFGQKGLWRKVMLVLVAAMAPICINSTEIILNGKCDETLNMMYSMVMVVPLIVIILERVHFSKEKIKNLIITIATVAFCLHIYGNVQIINDAYQRMNSSYETAYSVLCRVIDRVEQLPEWQDGNHTLYFDYGEDGGGYLFNDNYHAFVAMDEKYIDMGWMGVFGTGVYPFWLDYNTGNFVKCYFGLEYDVPTEEQIAEIKSSEEYLTLEKFPSLNAVQVIENVIVVRMDE